MQQAYILTGIMGRKSDVGEMVAALMDVVSSTSRANKKGAAATLAVLQEIARVHRGRPSELAASLDLHQSVITRRVQALQKAGLISVTADARDGRSCFIALNAAGSRCLQEMQDIGLKRFEDFVEDWSVSEIRTLASLLKKLVDSKAKYADRESRQLTKWRGNVLN